MSGSDDVTFRRADGRDRAAIERMALALYAEDYLGTPMTEAKVRRTLDRLSAEPNRGDVIVIEVRQAAVGYAILINYWSNEYGGDLLSIDELYVEPALRNLGIGRKFFEHLEATPRRDVVGLQLEVPPGNTRALALYQRLGFRPSENTGLIKTFV